MTYHNRSLERKDDSGAPSPELANEIKRFGDNVSDMRKSVEKDLADVRKMADEAKGGSADLEQKLIGITDGLVAKIEAADKLVAEQKARADKIEAAMSRPGSGLSDRDEAKVSEAVAFFEAKAAAFGNMKPDTRPTADNIDLDGYKAWESEFPMYLRAKDERRLSEKALSVGSDPDGGYLVPEAVSNRIITKIWESSPVRQYATVETVGTSTLEIHVDIDEADAGWVAETALRPETGTPQVDLQVISVHELYAKPKASARFLEDASINVDQWLAGKVAEKFARTEASAFVNGTGVAMPKGFLTYPAGSLGARGTIAQHASGAATSLTADAVRAMPLKIKQEYLGAARWMMHRSTVSEVMLMKDGQGQYLWRSGLTEGTGSVLAGYPVSMADDMPAVAAAALPIAFGNFGRAYTVVDRLGITTLRDPYSAKPFIEFYSRKRVGGDVTDFEAIALMVVSA